MDRYLFLERINGGEKFYFSSVGTHLDSQIDGLWFETPQ